MDSIKPTALPQAPPQTTAPAPAPAETQAPVVPQDFVQINVPMNIPADLLKPGANGQVPLASFQPKLIPPDAIITSEGEVKNLVDTVRKQAAPPGTHPEINPSAGGHKVDVAKQTIIKLSNTAGGLATYSLMRNGGFLAIPHAVALPLAIVGGSIGVIAGLDQAREALNLKGYYEGLKKDGVETIPIQVPVQTRVGVQVQVRDVAVDDLIKGAKDTAVVGGIQTAAGVLMAAAGMGGGPIAAIASVVLQAGAALYAAKGQLAMVATAAWDKVKHAFHHDGAKEAEQQPPAAPANGTAPAPEPPQQPQEAFIAGGPPKPTAG